MANGSRRNEIHGTQNLSHTHTHVRRSSNFWWGRRKVTIVRKKTPIAKDISAAVEATTTTTTAAAMVAQLFDLIQYTVKIQWRAACASCSWNEQSAIASLAACCWCCSFAVSNYNFGFSSSPSLSLSLSLSDSFSFARYFWMIRFFSFRNVKRKCQTYTHL